jgi:uncharacterized protein (TIGR01370 family)
MPEIPFLYQLQNESYSLLSSQSFKVAVVDMDDANLTASQVNTLHTQGKTLYTYLSIGEAEDYRDYWIDGNWSQQKPSFVLGENSDWPGNYSVKFWDYTWQSIMFGRVADAVANGYDGMYLDIVDAYEVAQVRHAYTGPDIRQAMIDFVVALSQYAKALDPDFKVIPQNAVGLLALTESNPDVPNTAYLNAIDGIGVEDLWYDGNSTSSWTSGDLEFIQNAVHAGKFVLATSYPTDDAKQDAFITNAINAGLIPFVADRDLTGVIDSIDLTIETRMQGHNINTPWTGGSSPTPTNHAPIALVDSYNDSQGTALVVDKAHGVLANDTDADGNVLKAVIATGPAHGTVVLNVDGSFTYTPATGFSGPDGFTYKANDGTTNSAATAVTINVAAAQTPTNHAPVAVADSYNDSQGTALVVDKAHGVLANDTDADGNVLKSVVATGPAHGTLLLNADGSFTYTPVSTYSGSDSFTYKANDGTADSGTVTVKIDISSISVPGDPLAGDDTIRGTYNADNLAGHAGNDVISGRSGSDTLDGGDGNDTLDGGSGNDTLLGGIGDDIIIGGGGRDFMTGGGGADHFVFTRISDTGTWSSARDVITDFEPSHDIIDLSAIDANSSLSGNQAFILRSAGAAFSDAGQVRFTYTTINGAEHTIVEGNVDKNLGADFKIDLVGHLNLTQADFAL